MGSGTIDLLLGGRNGLDLLAAICCMLCGAGLYHLLTWPRRRADAAELQRLWRACQELRRLVKVSAEATERRVARLHGDGVA